MLLRLIFIQPITLILLFLLNFKVLSQSNHSPQNLTNNSIPCLNSTPDCLHQLTTHAISTSSELAHLEAKINLIQQRLDLMAQKVDHANSRTWTNYLTLDPLRLMQNLFGGGDVQQDRIEIANLELSVAELEAVKAELERQKVAKQEEIENQIFEQLLNYEAQLRALNLAQNQLTTFVHQQQIELISYRLGQGSTEQYLASQLRGEQLENNLLEVQHHLYEIIRTVYQLTGYELNPENQQCDRLNRGSEFNCLFPTQ